MSVMATMCTEKIGSKLCITSIRPVFVAGDM